MFDWKSQAFPGYRPVREPWMTKIVDVHWPSGLYLYLQLYLVNNRFGRGGPYPIANANMPDYTVRVHQGAELHKQFNVETNALTKNGFLGCYRYIPQQTGHVDWGPEYLIPPPEGPLLWKDSIQGPVGMTAEAAYEYYVVGRRFDPFGGVRPAIDYNSCPAYDSQAAVAYIASWNDHAGREATYYHQVAQVPVSYFSRQIVMVEYLFSISPGDEVLTFNIANLLPYQFERDGPAQEGFGSAQLGVFSTAKSGLSKTTQVVADGNDGILFGDPLLDPDHVLNLNVSDANQGTFHVNINKHPDPNFTQVDNYGNKFRPYRIELSPIPLPIYVATSYPPQPPRKLG